MAVTLVKEKAMVNSNDEFVANKFHNPGNMAVGSKNKRVTPQPWKGLDLIYHVESNGFTYYGFDSDASGVRAMLVTLRTYRHVHGLVTWDQVVGRWAGLKAGSVERLNYVNHIKSMVFHEFGRCDAGDIQTAIMAIHQWEAGRHRWLTWDDIDAGHYAFSVSYPLDQFSNMNLNALVDADVRSVEYNQSTKDLTLLTNAGFTAVKVRGVTPSQSKRVFSLVTKSRPVQNMITVKDEARPFIKKKVDVTAVIKKTGERKINTVTFS